MVDRQELTIRDLERLTGFSARSIHHYISRGLLPGPEGSGPAARYGREHLLRLKLIEQARESGFKIDQRLQDAIDGLSVDDMEELVALAELSSARDTRRFGEWLLTGDWRRAAKGKPEASLLERRLPSTARLLEQSELWRGETSVAEELGASHEIRAMSDAPAGPRGTQSRSEARRRRAEKARSSRPRRRQRSERWERHRVGTGLEISWRPRHDKKFQYSLERLLEMAESLFGHYDRDDPD